MRRRRHALPDPYASGGAFLGGKPLSPLWRLGKSGVAAVFGEAPTRKRTSVYGFGGWTRGGTPRMGALHIAE